MQDIKTKKQVRMKYKQNTKKNPGEGEIFRTRRERPGAHPASFTVGTGSFSPKGKACFSHFFAWGDP